MTTLRSDEDDHGLRAALHAVAISGALLTLGSPFVLGLRGIVGVALGASIATLNLWALGRIVRAFMHGAGLPWILLGALKLVGLLALLALVLKLGLTSVIPLAIGYGALPVGIVFAQLGAGRPRAATAPNVSGIDADSGPKGR
jgi:hypothetical protein